MEAVFRVGVLLIYFLFIAGVSLMLYERVGIGAVVLFNMIGHGALCGFIAGRNSLSAAVWFLIGTVTGVLGLGALVALISRRS